MIAASIVYTAIEDVVRPDVRWRFALTFAFGLVHGLGFASMLEELLPPGDVVVPLLVFNLGVELGQLTIVAGRPAGVLGARLVARGRTLPPLGPPRRRGGARGDRPQVADRAPDRGVGALGADLRVTTTLAIPFTAPARVGRY